YVGIARRIKRCSLTRAASKSNSVRPIGLTGLPRWPPAGTTPANQFNDEGDAVMRRRLAALAVLPFLALAPNAQAQGSDPLGVLLGSLFTGALPGSPVFNVKATLYHSAARGVGQLDSLGCKVVPMRTIAVDKNVIPRRTVVFIKETVGL